MADAMQAAASAGGPTSHTLNQPTGTHGYTRQEQIDALRKLREPFPDSEIRFLPRVWCGACRNSRTKCCDNHPKRQCRTCGQSLTPAHIDLRFVGHAEATNRLLNVDPFWEWEPLATNPAGLPAYDDNRGLWIRLTVCGMTRLGYGHAAEKSGGDAIKEIIGDAIRNAGMRFGMALDLWTSSDLEKIENGGEEPGSEQPRAVPSPRQETPAPGTQAEAPSPDLRKLYEQASQVRSNLNALTQIQGEAEVKGLLGELVPTRSGPRPFGEVLDELIAQAAPGQTEGRAA